MKKVIRDGKVAVAYSPSFGAGWYSWNSSHVELLFHPKIITMILEGMQKHINENWILTHLGIADVYCGGADDLTILWLPIGTKFKVDEYDGSEYITTEEDLIITA